MIHNYAVCTYLFLLVSSVKEMAKANNELTPINGYLTFEPGVTQRRVAISTVDDDTPEDDTPFTVVLYSPLGGARLDTESAEFKMRLEGNFMIIIANNFIFNCDHNLNYFYLK